MSEQKNMEKPFTMDLNYVELIEKNEDNSSKDEIAEKNKEKPVKPFRLGLPPKDNSGRLYLILLYIEDGNESELLTHFEFITGRQTTYDKLKDMILYENVDAMKSLVLVDSPKVSISHKYSVYQFMRDMKEKLLIKDETSFDINDYYYEVDEDEQKQK